MELAGHVAVTTDQQRRADQVIWCLRGQQAGDLADERYLAFGPGWGRRGKGQLGESEADPVGKDGAQQGNGASVRRAAFAHQAQRGVADPQRVFPQSLTAGQQRRGGRVVAALIETLIVVAAIYAIVSAFVPLHYAWSPAALLPAALLVVTTVGY